MQGKGSCFVAFVAAIAACTSTTPEPEAPQGVATEVRTFVEPVSEATMTDVVVREVGDDRVVLLGEATHGTEEFYRARAAISLRLAVERGFDAFVFEADWPAMARVDRYVRGEGPDTSAHAALGEFTRFPRWMWRNEAFAAFVEAVRAYNAARPAHEHVRMFGMDLYSAVESGAAVVEFLRTHDADAAAAATQAYRCLPQAVAFALAPGNTSCATAVAGPLAAVERFASRAGGFDALQNARLVVNAEKYYRLAQTDATASWNHRDQHMVATLAAIEGELAPARGEVRQVVWAHNSHVGDARATENATVGQLNVGQLARERWGKAVTNVGFTTYTGTVFAAPAWDAEGRVFDIKPGRADAIEGVFHQVGEPRFALVTSRSGVADAIPWLWERAIGVVYSPSTEAVSHYFGADVAAQFDVVLHVDESHALTPLSP